MSEGYQPIFTVLEKHEESILVDWIDAQLPSGKTHRRISESELRRQGKEFLELLRDAAKKGDAGDIGGASWQPVRDMLGDISKTRSEQGFSPSETAMFIFALKKPLFAQLRQEFGKDAERFAEVTWQATELLDTLGLFTMEAFLRAREGVILRQQEDMLELSTPVVALTDGVLALPLIGTLDSARTQVVMESLLDAIMKSGSTIAIIDITGVPTVDTLVAQHLLKTVTAARLMGADCILSGIRPQIAQTIVHLGVELGDIVTKATLAGALKTALERQGMAITRTAERPRPKA